MLSYLKQSTASQTRIVGPFVDDTDFKTAETGLTINNTDVKLSANGGTAANKNSGGGTHITNGDYAITLDATDTATVGELSISISVSGALIVKAKFVVLEEAVYDAMFASGATGGALTLGGSAVANLEDDYDGTGYTKANSVIGTCTTNTDMVAEAPSVVAITAGVVGDPLLVSIESDTSTLVDTRIPDTISLANINAQVDTALTDYDAPTNTEMVAAFTEIKGGTWATTDTLEAIRDRGDAAWITAAGFSTHSLADVLGADSDTLKTLSDQIDGLSTAAAPQLLQNTTIATLASQTSFTLTAGSADDDAYNGGIAIITDSSTSSQKAVASVSNYVGSTKTITLSTDPAIFTMATGDTIDILAAIGSAPTAVAIRTEIDSNSSQLAAIVADTNELQTNQGNWLTATGFSTHDAAAVNTAVVAGQVGTDAAEALAKIDDIEANGAKIKSWTGTALADLDTQVDTALANYDGPTNTEMVAAFTEIKGATWASGTDTLEAIRDRGDAAWTGGGGGGDATASNQSTIITHLTDIKGGTWASGTDTLEAIRDRGDAAWTTGAGGSPPQLLVSTTIATLTDQQSFELTAGSADDDAYNGALVVITDAATSTQQAVSRVGDYTGSTKTITLVTDPAIFTMAVGDTVELIATDNTVAVGNPGGVGWLG